MMNRLEARLIMLLDNLGPIIEKKDEILDKRTG